MCIRDRPMADNSLVEEEEFHDNSKSDALINSLAPEQDPISDLNNNSTQFRCV